MQAASIARPISANGGDNAASDSQREGNIPEEMSELPERGATDLLGKLSEADEHGTGIMGT